MNASGELMRCAEETNKSLPKPEMSTLKERLNVISGFRCATPG